MGIITPDTSQAEDFGSPIAAGTYKAKIVECPTGLSKAGNAKITPKFKLQVDGKERTRTSNLVTTGAGAIGFDHLLRACGFKSLADDYRDPNVSPKPPFDTDSLVGQELSVVVEDNLYKDANGNEKKGDQITDYLPL